MMDWEETTLGEVCEIKYGKDHKKLSDGQIPCYGSGGIMRYVESEIYNKPSVLIPRKGTLSNLFYIDKPFWTVDTLFYTKINNSKIEARYLFNLLKTYNLEGLNVGSAVPSLTTAVLNQVKIKIPKEVNEQKAIANVLTAFDDKIELLQQQNTTLETIAQTIFKEWFGKYQLGDELPDGYEVVKLDQLVEIGSSKRIFASEYLEDGIPFYRGKEITELSKGNSISTEIFISLEKYNELKQNSGVPKENDIILTSVGTIGNTYLVKKNDKFYFKDGNLTWVKNYKTYIDAFFIYEWFQSNNASIAMDSIKIGSTQQAITIAALNTLEIVIPSKKDYLRVKNIFESNMLKRQINQEQIQSLTKTRDTLLPKLMSGQVRVKM